MPENPLIALAAAMRTALSQPVAADDKAAQMARLDLIDMIPDLQRSLIGEQAFIRDLTWQPLNLVTLQAINRFKIAQHVPLEGTISYKELSALTGTNESQLRRLVRHAMTNRIFHEPEKGQVAHSVTSKLLAEDPRLDSWVFFLTDYFWPATARSVDAFQKWPGSQNPKEVGVSLQYGRETTWFGEISTADRGIQSFRDAMEIINDGEGWEDSHLVDNYPWGEIGKGTVVDIGGSNGHTSMAIAEKFPDLKFIVQDLHTEGNPVPESLKERIIFMDHDMLNPQPIKDADVYFWRNVFHNHPDASVTKALQSLIPALKPGAKIAIQDFGLTDPGEGRLADESYERMMDIMMMSLMNGKERGLDEWKALFEQADSRFKWNGGSRPDGSRLWIIKATWEP
ncbi:related to sterigmatocystin 7-O-methyltransferase precursor [Phialocephala subalpina]|uniref:Related to sterigmatocystin 7-O-methyltransferase n=1 Tax=Phialocephala subalpina TaxID=576137 RepID=A0A1L7XGF2_9HELO|nr:related to sterigmatocystin 7-O-methyltransferase precursor [Phialocephala subalpina]